MGLISRVKSRPPEHVCAFCLLYNPNIALSIDVIRNPVTCDIPYSTTALLETVL